MNTLSYDTNKKYFVGKYFSRSEPRPGAASQELGLGNSSG